MNTFRWIWKKIFRGMHKKVRKTKKSEDKTTAQLLQTPDQQPAIVEEQLSVDGNLIPPFCLALVPCVDQTQCMLVIRNTSEQRGTEISQVKAVEFPNVPISNADGRRIRPSQYLMARLNELTRLQLHGLLVPNPVLGRDLRVPVNDNRTTTPVCVALVPYVERTLYAPVLRNTSEQRGTGIPLVKAVEFPNFPISNADGRRIKLSECLVACLNESTRLQLRGLPVLHPGIVTHHGTTTPVRKMMVIPCIQRSRVATVKRNVIKQEATGATTKQTPNDLDTLYDAEDILFNDIESKNGSGDHVFKKSVITEHSSIPVFSTSDPIKEIQDEKMNFVVQPIIINAQTNNEEETCQNVCPESCDLATTSAGNIKRRKKRGGCRRVRGLRFAKKALSQSPQTPCDRPSRLDLFTSSSTDPRRTGKKH